MAANKDCGASALRVSIFPSHHIVFVQGGRGLHPPSQVALHANIALGRVDRDSVEF